MSKLEAGAVADAHTRISENSAPHRSEQRFADGWHAGARDVTGHLLRTADPTASVQRGRAASPALLRAHLQQPASPAPHQAPAPAPAAAALDGEDVLAAAERFPWAHADGLLVRHDYEVDIQGGNPAARYLIDPVEVQGIILPSKLRIFPRQEDNTPAPEPLIVSVDLSGYRFE